MEVAERERGSWHDWWARACCPCRARSARTSRGCRRGWTGSHTPPDCRKTMQYLCHQNRMVLTLWSPQSTLGQGCSVLWHCTQQAWLEEYTFHTCQDQQTNLGTAALATKGDSNPPRTRVGSTRTPLVKLCRNPWSPSEAPATAAPSLWPTLSWHVGTP